jgi:hypothetical protein
MEILVDTLLVALAAATLAASAAAALTGTRVHAWALTATLLWLATASLTASALLGSPLALVVAGASLAFAGLLAGMHALFGRSTHDPIEIRHALNA